MSNLYTITDEEIARYVKNSRSYVLVNLYDAAVAVTDSMNPDCASLDGCEENDIVDVHMTVEEARNLLTAMDRARRELKRLEADGADMDGMWRFYRGLALFCAGGVVGLMIAALVEVAMR